MPSFSYPMHEAGGSDVPITLFAPAFQRFRRKQRWITAGLALSFVATGFFVYLRSRRLLKALFDQPSSAQISDEVVWSTVLPLVIFLFGSFLVTLMALFWLERTRERLYLAACSDRLCQLLDEAREAQLRDISLWLHGTVGHALTLLNLHVQKGVLSQQIPPAIAETLQHNVADLIREIRAQSYILYPQILHLVGAREALKQLVEVHGERDGAPPVDARFDLPENLTPPVAHLLYRIVQEGLQNAITHAPGSPVTIRIWTEGRMIVGTLQNTLSEERKTHRLQDKTHHRGIGLWALAERTRRLGGNFAWNTNLVSRIFSLSFRFPMDP